MLKINFLVRCSIIFQDCGWLLVELTLMRHLLTSACTFTFCVVQVREAGMSVSEKDNDGATPLHFASARGGHI